MRKLLPKHWHHKVAVFTFISVAIGDVVCGLLFAHFQHIPDWHGVYCALANSVTVGGDVSPSTNGGYWVNSIECLFIIPLAAATLSFFTSGLAATEVHNAKQEIIDAQSAR